jgi:hypothetical protein
MAIDFLERSDVIEECYEFLLGYAAQGLPTDEDSAVGREVRTQLQRAREALIGLPESCWRAVTDQQLEPITHYDGFRSTLESDVQASLACIDLVLAQPALSSQLIDNLNASIHLRALLTDLFLFGEVLRTRVKLTVALEGE